jgi:outer membrane biosynthesis protein TonB
VLSSSAYTFSKDPGFCSPVGETNDGAVGARKLGVSPEEIAKIKEEWEEKQKKKQEKEKEKAKEKEKEKEKDEKEKEKDNKDKDKAVKDDKKKEVVVESKPDTPSATAHARYALHRDFFASECSLQPNCGPNLNKISSEIIGTSQATTSHAGQGTCAEITCSTFELNI